MSLQFNQPLFRNRSIDLNRRSIKIQKKFIQQTDSDFRQRTIQIISQVQAAYWNLVFALRNQQNQLESLNVARQNMRNIEAQIEAGAKAPLDRAQVQTDISARETQLFISTQNVSIAENTLKQLMLRDPAAPEWTAQITPTDTPVLDLSPVNLQLALDEAHKNRPEIRRLNLQKEINAIDIDYYKNQTKPQVDLTGTFALTGLAGHAMRYRYEPALFAATDEPGRRLRKGHPQLVQRRHAQPDGWGDDFIPVQESNCGSESGRRAHSTRPAGSFVPLSGSGN